MKPQMQRGLAAAPWGSRGAAAEALAAAVRAVILLAALSMIALRGWLADAGTLGQVIASAGAAYLVASAALAWRSPRAFEKNSLVFTSIDIFWITWLVWLTGERGPQYLLYYVPILHAAVRLSVRDATAAAILSTACYAFAEIAAPHAQPGTRFLAPVVFGVSAAVIAGILAGLAGQSRLAPMEQTKSPADAVNLVRSAAISADADSLAAAMAGAACRALDADAARLCLTEPATGKLCAVASAGSSSAWFGDDARLAERIQDKGEPVFAPRKLPDELAVAGLALPGSAGSYIGVPLRARGYPVGVLEVAWRSRCLQEEDLDTSLVLGAEIAQRLAGAMQPAVAQSVRDPVTGLWSHTEFQQRLAEEIARASRMREQLCVLLVDIDRFGLFNERHGHRAGDSLIAAMARRLELETRAADVLARYGGDEFALLMPQTDRDGGLLAGERLRQAVEQASLSVPGAVVEPVTVSVAAACFPEDGNTARDCVAAAKRALGSAGANRVVSAREGA